MRSSAYRAGSASLIQGVSLGDVALPSLAYEVKAFTRLAGEAPKATRRTAYGVAGARSALLHRDTPSPSTRHQQPGGRPRDADGGRSSELIATQWQTTA